MSKEKNWVEVLNDVSVVPVAEYPDSRLHFQNVIYHLNAVEPDYVETGF